MKKENNLYQKALRMAGKKDIDLKIVFKMLTDSYQKENDFRAAYAIGTWFLHGKFVKKNIKKAMEYILLAAGKNIPEAMYDLAVSYEKGVGVEQNKIKAFEFYLKAALAGEKQSIYEIGRCYYHGIGISKNKKIASIWLDRADELGIN